VSGGGGLDLGLEAVDNGSYDLHHMRQYDNPQQWPVLYWKKK
jgi:hypothetical protein